MNLTYISVVNIPSPLEEKGDGFANLPILLYLVYFKILTFLIEYKPVRVLKICMWGCVVWY